MRIAVVGGGVSGLVAAHRVAAEHEVTLFEAAPRLGGHTRTVEVDEEDGRRVAVDIGFIVYNERTYPRFTALLAELAVATRPTSMSFSVRCERSGLEYASADLGGLFAQRRNLVRPRFWSMLRGALRFHREAQASLAAGEALALGEFLRRGRYPAAFVEDHLEPMLAAIWSAAPSELASFPARGLFEFLANHGLLSVADQPTWRTVVGGSQRYVDRLTAALVERGVRLATATPVVRVARGADGVRLGLRDAGALAESRFDHVVLAVHADQALRMLADPSAAEHQVLGAVPYRPNSVVLHTDERFLPRRPRARASWNYHLGAGSRAAGPRVTYWMNRLQGIASRRQYLVTLNRSDEIDPRTILHVAAMAHPVYSLEGAAAQRRWAEIQGAATSYCGAWWGHGFHEDGVRSGERAAARLLAGVAAGEVAA